MQLENGSAFTWSLAAQAVGRSYDPNSTGETIIDNYIERSRKTMLERIKAKQQEKDSEPVPLYENKKIEPGKDSKYYI